MDLFDDLVKAWLKESNQDQCRWAFHYLGLDKGQFAFHTPTDTPYYTHVVRDIQSWENNFRTRARIAAMKAAWRQKKFRQNNPLKTPYSFFLKKSTKKHLAKCADQAGLTQNQLLEKLICNAWELEEHRQRDVRNQIKEIRQKVSKPKPSIESVPKTKFNKLERDLGKRQDQLRDLKKFCEDQLVALAEATAKLEIAGLSSQKSTTEEDELAMNKFTGLSASLEKILKQ